MPKKNPEKPLLRGHFHQAAFFLAIGAKFWLGIEKLNSFYFGLVTGILIYFTLIGIANIPVDPTTIG